MPTPPGSFWSTEHVNQTAILALVLLFASAFSVCSRKELIVTGPSTLEYRSVGPLHWLSGSFPERDINGYCEVLFSAAQDKHVIHLVVTESALIPRLTDSNECSDKIIAYDGSTVYNTVLGYFCGQEMKIYESTGRTLLLVLETKTNTFPNDYYNKGFTLNYSSIPRSEPLKDKSQSSVGIGTVAPAVIFAALLYCVLFVVLYRRCKYAQRVRNNLPVPGHRPEELRVAMANMPDQNNLGQVNQGQSPSLHYGINNRMPEILAGPNMSSRTGSAHSESRPTRVRHPAGDTYYLLHQHSQQPQITLLYSSHHNILNDNCSGYGSDRDEPYRAASEPMGRIHNYSYFPVIPSDPSGVFYAGSIDEHGVLHPPSEHGATMAPTSVISTDYVQPFIGHRQEDDRRSRESNNSCRSLYHTGRNPSRDSSHAGSSGRSSPYRNRIHNTVVIYNGGTTQLVKNMDPEGQTLTFYGMIDGGVSAASCSDVVEESSISEENSSSLHPGETTKLSPPPSYEDAASGKYSPHPANK